MQELLQTLKAEEHAHLRQELQVRLERVPESQKPLLEGLLQQLQLIYLEEGTRH